MVLIYKVFFYEFFCKLWATIQFKEVVETVGMWLSHKPTAEKFLVRPFQISAKQRRGTHKNMQLIVRRETSFETQAETVLSLTYFQPVECQECTSRYVATTQPHFRGARRSWITDGPLRYVGLQFYVVADC
jgi:hypothetical protein